MNVDSVLYENIFKPEKQILIEYVKQTYPKWRKVFSYIFGLIGCLFGIFIISSYTSSEYKQDATIYSAVLILAFCILTVFLPLIHYRFYAKKLLTRMLDRTSEISFYENCFVVKGYSSPDSPKYKESTELVSEYSKIYKLVPGKIGLYIAIDKDFYTMIRKDSFITGNYESFEVFLREKLKNNPRAVKGLVKRNRSAGSSVIINKQFNSNINRNVVERSVDDILQNERFFHKNIYTLEKKLIFEFCRKTYPMKAFVLICLLIIAGISIILFDITLFLDGYNKGYINVADSVDLAIIIILLIPGVVCILLSAVFIIRVYVDAKLTSTRLSGNTVETIFFNDYFTYNTSILSATSSYDDISRLITAKIGLYITVGANIHVLIKKDSFTVGDYESFVLFMREKLKNNPRVLKGLK